MKLILSTNVVVQTFKEDPLMWLWALLGVAVLVGIGVLVSWFWGKPVVKFYIDGKVESIVPLSRGEKLTIPMELTEYQWFFDKKLTKKFTEGRVVKGRVVCLYTSTQHQAGGMA